MREHENYETISVEIDRYALDYFIQDTYDNILKWKVYQYHFIDDIGLFINPMQILKPTYISILAIHKVTQVFKSAGWEKDHEIQIAWLPPFVDFSPRDLRGDTSGIWFWHVKQSNNGTSWLTSNEDLKLFKPSIDLEHGYKD